MNPVTLSVDTFFAWLTQTSLQACVLVGLVLVLGWILRERMAPRWRHALWLLVVIRLVLPWAPESRLSIYNLFSASGESPRVALPNPNSSPHWVTGSETVQGPEHNMQVPTVASPSPDRSETLSLGQVLRWVWGVGAVSLLAIVTLQSLILTRAIGRERFLTDQRVLDLLEDCKDEMRIRAYLAVVETDRVKCPALFGFIRPKFLLPVGTIADLGPERLRHVFLHELAHLKRHDVVMNWLLSLLQVMHWFNPLVWYAFARLRAEREMTCDALVLTRTYQGEPAEYGRTIIHLLERFSHTRAVPNLAGVLEERNQMKRRIAMIARFKTSHKRWPLAAATAIILLAATALTNAEQSAKTESEEKPVLVRSACEFLATLVQEDFSGATKQFDPTMKKTLSESKLKKAWKDLPEQFGPFGKATGFSAEKFLSSRTVLMRCEFEKGPLDVKVVFDRKKRISGLWFVPTSGGEYETFDTTLRQGLSQAAIKVLGEEDGKRAARIVIEDIAIQPYSEGGLYVLVVTLRNLGQKESSEFKVLFLKDDPAQQSDPMLGLKPIREGYNSAGPIPPKSTWAEVCMPFTLREGVNLFVALVDPENTVLDPDERNRNRRAEIKMTVKDGKIIAGSITKVFQDISSRGNANNIDANGKWNRPSYVPETSTLDADGRIADKIDYPFEDDPRVAGTWKSVDFVSDPQEFEPGRKKSGHDPFLEELVFLPKGRTAQPWRTWTKGLVFHSGDRTASQYILKEIDGASYMFFESKNGDYLIRQMKPQWYVLKKESSETGGLAEGWASQPSNEEFRRAFPKKIAKLDLATADPNGVIAAFGKPGDYILDEAHFESENLPTQYLMVYPDEFMVLIRENRIIEIRYHRPGYFFRDKIQVGSSLDDILAILGAPTSTVEGQKNEFTDGVLYKDIEGRKGRCYYSREDQGIRISFTDYKAKTIYVMPPQNASSKAKE